jgi:hypothetical protein
MTEELTLTVDLGSELHGKVIKRAESYGCTAEKLVHDAAIAYAEEAEEYEAMSERPLLTGPPGLHTKYFEVDPKTAKRVEKLLDDLLKEN